MPRCDEKIPIKNIDNAISNYETSKNKSGLAGKAIDEFKNYFNALDLSNCTKNYKLNILKNYYESGKNSNDGKKIIIKTLIKNNPSFDNFINNKEKEYGQQMNTPPPLPPRPNKMTEEELLIILNDNLTKIKNLEEMVAALSTVSFGELSKFIFGNKNNNFGELKLLKFKFGKTNIQQIKNIIDGSQYLIDTNNLKSERTDKIILEMNELFNKSKESQNLIEQNIKARVANKINEQNIKSREDKKLIEYVSPNNEFLEIDKKIFNLTKNKEYNIKKLKDSKDSSSKIQKSSLEKQIKLFTNEINNLIKEKRKKFADKQKKPVSQKRKNAGNLPWYKKLFGI
jgi:hypothetical protein